MRADDFLTEQELGEYKIVDFAKNIRKLKPAVDAFELRTMNATDKSDTDYAHATMLDIATEFDIRPKVFQNYLIHKGLI